MPAQPIVHIEIPAANPHTSSNFYTAVFGWEKVVSPGFEEYPMFRAEGGPAGGFTTAGSGHGPYRYTIGEVLIYLASSDIDADLQRVQEHGGQIILSKTEIPGVGYWAIFQDPAGNKLGLFSNL